MLTLKRTGDRFAFADRFCARSLPSYMSPDVFHFVDRLRRTLTDKVDYQQLTRAAGGALAAPVVPSVEPSA